MSDTEIITKIISAVIFLAVIGTIIYAIDAILIYSSERHYNKICNHQSEVSNTLFLTFLYLLSDVMPEENIKRYLSNSAKVAINKGLIALVEGKNENNFCDEFANSFYDDVITVMKDIDNIESESESER